MDFMRVTRVEGGVTQKVEEFERIISEEEKLKNFRKEKNALMKIAKDQGKHKDPIAIKVILRVAFMSATLDELEKEANRIGAVELFENGKQKMLRENPALKAYNTLYKNYHLGLKFLSEILSTEDATPGNAVLDFVKNKQGVL